MPQLGAASRVTGAPVLAHWLAERPFTLAMSSGFFAFYAHAGLLSALLARGLPPAAVSGSSAGAIIAGAHAAGVPIDELIARLVAIRRDDFWDPKVGLGLLAGRKFERLLRELLPVEHIEACRVPLHISVYDILARRTRVLRDGDLATAIRASCALPGMFHPVRVGTPPRLCWDGGIADHPAIAGLGGERVFVHHIATGGRAPPRGVTSLMIEGLPQPHPFRLEVGPRAVEIARAATLRALDQPWRECVRLPTWPRN